MKMDGVPGQWEDLFPKFLGAAVMAEWRLQVHPLEQPRRGTVILGREM